MATWLWGWRTYYTGRGKIAVDADGRVSVNGSEVNKVKIVDFEKPYTLQRIRTICFSVRRADCRDIAAGRVELSNVNSVKEMAAMISVLRVMNLIRKL